VSNKIKKRFIAGATCPKCKAMDTLMLYFENNIEKMECVTCGYQQSQTERDIETATRAKENVIGVFKP
jgi:uncharacterized protein